MQSAAVAVVIHLRKTKNIIIAIFLGLKRDIQRHERVTFAVFALKKKTATATQLHMKGNSIQAYAIHLVEKFTHLSILKQDQNNKPGIQ